MKAVINIKAGTPKMTSKLERLLGQVEEDIRIGRNISGPFTSGEEMDKHLATIDTHSNLYR